MGDPPMRSHEESCLRYEQPALRHYQKYAIGFRQDYWIDMLVVDADQEQSL